MRLTDQWEKLLNIKTTGRDDSNSDTYRYPYEPTPYEVLERLANSGYVTKRSHLIDYGCGKGRVDFYLSYQTRCHCTGVEYDDRIFDAAMVNKERSISGSRVGFIHGKAEQYSLPEDADCLYFFNPFSVELLEKVLARILHSYYEHPRQMYLFFYYPSNEYISCLMTLDMLSFVDEINCEDLYSERDPREKILIFEIA